MNLSNQIIFTMEDTKLWGSKLGGCPYPEDIEQYPKGTDGGPMMFLAQINLAEMPSLPEFPHEGLLQFYVKMTAVMDCMEDVLYNNKLKWDMLESDVTEEQLVMFEQENDLTLPKQFKEFALGYSFLQGRFYAFYR